MIKINCEICEDLIPLVKDGVASEESRRAVEAHTAVCPKCRALLGDAPDLTLPSKTPVVARVQKKVRLVFLLLLFVGTFFGVCVTQETGAFDCLIIMPVVGALAYGLSRWKALWQVPLLMLGTYFLAQLLQAGGSFNLLGCLLWAAITAVFSEAGVLIAGLLHFGLRKEKQDEK